MEVTAKDLILIVGGLFLLGKATWEIHHNLEGAKSAEPEEENGAGSASGASGADDSESELRGTGLNLAFVLGQILMLDLVFSIDSVLTAVGMVRPDDYQSAPFPFTTIPWVPLTIMIAAVLAAIGVMLIFIGPIARFIRKHPTMKMLALSFLLLVGVVLIAEGLGQPIDRRYIYFAMGFSFFVEMMNLRIMAHRRRKAQAEQEAK